MSGKLVKGAKINLAAFHRATGGVDERDALPTAPSGRVDTERNYGRTTFRRDEGGGGRYNRDNDGEGYGGGGGEGGDDENAVSRADEASAWRRAPAAGARAGTSGDRYGSDRGGFGDRGGYGDRGGDRGGSDRDDRFGSRGGGGARDFERSGADAGGGGGGGSGGGGGGDGEETNRADETRDWRSARADDRGGDRGGDRFSGRSDAAPRSDDNAEWRRYSRDTDRPRFGGGGERSR